MSRYIDADALIAKWEEDIKHIPNTSFRAMMQGAINEVSNAPTADVVEVVRCEDCVYWEQATDNSGNCNRAFEITAYGSDYCSYGERREDGE